VDSSCEEDGKIICKNEEEVASEGEKKLKDTMQSVAAVTECRETG